MKHINNIIIKASKVCLVATALLSLTTSCSDLLEKILHQKFPTETFGQEKVMPN